MARTTSHPQSGIARSNADPCVGATCGRPLAGKFDLCIRANTVRPYGEIP